MSDPATSPASRRVRAGVLAVAGALALLSGQPVAAQDRVNQEDAKKRLEESQRELEATRGKEKELSGDIERLEEERATLNTALIATAKRVQASEARLSKIEARLATLSGQEQEVRGSIKERHAIISRLLAAMQRIGRQPPPAVVTRRNDALKMVRSAMLMASVFPELKFQAEGLKAELDDLVRLGEGIRLQRDELKSENEKLIADRDRIGGLIAEKQAMARARQEKLARIREAAARHAKDVSYLGELVKRMDREIASAGLSQYEAELAAKKAEEAVGAETEKPRKTTKVALLSPGRLKPAVEFAETRGKLAMPVSGSPVRDFGAENEVGERAKGISIASRPKAQVTSPVDGWVAYADKFRTYGQLLIINAGGGYHILLAGMQRIDVGVGQFVLAGEPVAVMGVAPGGAKREPNSPGPVLYVEFRKDGRSIDPGPWWAKSPERLEG